MLDGAKSSSGWQAFIPFEHNVMDKNPERGFVSSANQYPADETYPYYIQATSYEAYRNRRINNVLREANQVTVQDMMRLQNDNYSIRAEESLPLLLSHLNSASFNEAEQLAFKTLQSWDYTFNATSEAPSYYEALWTNLMPLIWDEMRRDDLSLSTPTSWNTIFLMKNHGEMYFQHNECFLH